MKLDYVYTKFIDIERRNNLLDLQLSNVYMWEKVRYALFNELLNHLNLRGEAHTKESFSVSNVLKYLYKHGIRSILYAPFFLPQRDILFWGHKRKKKNQEGIWQDIYCSPIIARLEKKEYLYLDSPFLFEHRKPLDIENARYLDLILFISFVILKLKILSVKIEKKDEKLIKKIQKEIKKEFGVNLNIMKEVYKKIVVHKVQKYFFEWILQKVKPKVVVLVVSYGKEAMIEVCKELAIKTIELQHGVVDKYHLGYSYPYKKKNLFPDYFFSFGEYWKNVVEYPIKKERIISVGYPYLEEETKKCRKLKRKNQILFISQGSIGRELSALAVEISKKSNLGYKLTYKLHPGECEGWREKYPDLVHSNINVVEDSQESLYKLMAESEIQVGVYSTALYEGLYLGLQTYLLDCFGIEYMSYLLEQGLATKITGSADFLCKIKKDELKSVLVKENIFQGNSLENAISEIRKISNH